MFSCSVFIFYFESLNGVFYSIDDKVFKFLTYFYESMKPFDTSWVLLFGIILNFNSHTLFNPKTTTKKRIISLIISYILTTITIIGKSFALDNTLDTLHSSLPQLIKIII